MAVAVVEIDRHQSLGAHRLLLRHRSLARIGVTAGTASHEAGGMAGVVLTEVALLLLHVPGLVVSIARNAWKKLLGGLARHPRPGLQRDVGVAADIADRGNVDNAARVVRL